MKISNVSLIDQDGLNVFSAQCGDFKLWYKFPKTITPDIRADAFIAASLIPAMYLNSNIILDNDIPVSPKLLSNIDTIQDVFACWSQHLGVTLHKIKIIGGKTQEAISGSGKIMSFFSGGVDGTYTFIKHQQEIDFLFFAKGIDMQLSSDDLYQDALERNTQYLEQKNKPLIPIETNVRFLGGHYGLGWSICFGSGLASIALAAGVKKCFIASGLSYANKHPEGSDPLTDRLWSNETTEIVHDGAEKKRIDKVKSISKDKAALNILRVCWHDISYNCGKCEKCLRTMANLRALKLTTPTFPLLTDEIAKERLAKLKIYDVHNMDFLEENLEQATLQKDVVLMKALTKVKKNYQLRKILRLLDQYIFTGGMAKFKRKIRR